MKKFVALWTTVFTALVLMLCLVGCKTGTAQKYEDGHIAAGKYVSSFVGFFPSDSPRYLALIVVDEPVGTYYGSAVAAPVAREIFEDIIKIKNIQPYE